MKKIQPLKRFGQNYLTDGNILDKIAAEINPLEDDKLIEIGPGLGALTERLIKKNLNLTAVEIDKRVGEELVFKFPTLTLIQDDFLKVNLRKISEDAGKKLRIAGNIPYNLTSPILFKLIADNNIILDAVLMVQFEVAQRMTAKKGTKDYGILAVLVQYFTDAKIAFKVSPNVFYPKPKVYSAVIHFYFKELPASNAEKKIFINIVKAAFGNRRKTLKNSLSNSIFGDIDFSGSGIDLSLRAEQLDIADFLSLANFVRTKLP